MKGLLLVLLFTWGTAQAQYSDRNGLNYQKADSVAALYKGESLENVPLLVYNLTSPFENKLEQFRAIYTWICTNLENDYYLYQINKKKREKLHQNPPAWEAWNASFQARVFKKLRAEKKTVCSGYAYLLREMAALVDIPCRIIHGYGRTIGANVGTPAVPNHSWNAVQLDGNFYLCDATWSSGSINPKERSFIPDYNDAYFLADPELFVKSHYPLDTSWILLDLKPSLDDFLHGPIVYKHAFTHRIIPQQAQGLNLEATKGEQFTLLWKAPETLNTQDLAYELRAGNKHYTFPLDMQALDPGLWQVQLEWPSLGKYDLHFKMGEDYLMTYVVRVSKPKK